jgi:hypothetical protein
MMMPILSKAGLSLGPGSLDALTEKKDSERYKPDGKEQYLANLAGVVQGGARGR